jgi:hypothetical protein
MMMRKAMTRKTKVTTMWKKSEVVTARDER